MNAKFLKKRPESGEYIERAYSPRYYDDRWVLFEDDNYNEWVGIFGSGSFGCEKILLFPNTNVVLVIAKGEDYIVNINTGKLIYSNASCGNILNAFIVGVNDFILAWEYGNIYAFSSKKLLDKCGQFIDIDKIEFNYISNDIIKGEVHDCMDIFEIKIDLKNNKILKGNLIGTYDCPIPFRIKVTGKFKYFLEQLYYRINNFMIIA